jgi:shikimate dehydrogenase
MMDKTLQRYGLLGSGIGTSRSPIIFNHWFSSLGWNCVYDLVDIVWHAGVLEACHRLGFLGLNVTTPYKPSVASSADVLSREVRESGTANIVRWDAHGRVEAANMDIKVLEGIAERHWDAGVWVWILGSGGVARSTAWVARSYGASVGVVARRPSSMESWGEVGRGLVVRETLQDLWYASGHPDRIWVVQATPLGLQGWMDHLTQQEGLAFSIVGTVDYDYRQTELSEAVLRLAFPQRIEGYRGLWLLEAQARLGFGWWFGQSPPESIGASDSILK